MTLLGSGRKVQILKVNLSLFREGAVAVVHFCGTDHGDEIQYRRLSICVDGLRINWEMFENIEFFQSSELRMFKPINEHQYSNDMSSC